MRKITVITLCLTALFAVQACNSGKAPAKPEGMPQGQLDTLSMVIGLYFQNMIVQTQVPEINYDLLFKTMKKARDGKEVGVTIEQIDELYPKYMQKKGELIAAENQKKGEVNQKKGAEFLAKNKTKKGVVALESGLQYKIIEEGTGIQPSANDIITAHYKGTLIDGTPFDSSYDRNEPITTPLSGMIPGWIEGFQHFKEGTKAILYVPADLAYREMQRSEVITPYSTLIFEVELISVTPAPTPDVVEEEQE